MQKLLLALSSTLPVILTILIILAALVAVWLLVMLAKALRLGRGPVKKGSVFVPVDAECTHAAESLSALLRYKTVSRAPRENIEYVEFEKLRDYLRRRYPNAHKVMARETVGYTIVYRWAAPNRSVGKPILLCGHLDVVPAEGEWTHDPFGGEIFDGYVWGRGSLDCKNVVVSIMEAIESLAAEGFVPERDIYIVLGHDEEIGGAEGAGAVAKLFRGEDIQFEMVLDEGPPLRRGVMGVKQPMALVGVAEKGNMDIKLTAKSDGGHASVPPRHTALGLVAEAVCRIEFRQRHAILNPVMAEYLRLLAPSLPLWKRVKLTNLWFFKRSVLTTMSKDPAENALIRTTAAATMSRCGTAPNVLPQRAETIVNFRPAHGDKCSDIIIYIKELVRDLNIEVDVMRREDASAVSNYKNKPYAVLSETINDIFGRITVSPYIMQAATDSRKYEELCDSVYRFCPFVLTPSESALMHGNDERVSIASLGVAVEFYKRLILRTTNMRRPMGRPAEAGAGVGPKAAEAAAETGEDGNILEQMPVKEQNGNNIQQK